MAGSLHRAGMVRFELRASDDYLLKSGHNIRQYLGPYLAFLGDEVCRLKEAEAVYTDVDKDGRFGRFAFRRCDVEMALWQATQ